MGHLVTLVSSTLARKKAFLAHVKVEAFETSVSTEGIHSKLHSDIECLPKSQDWILFTNVTFCLMLCSLSRGKPAIKGGNEKMKKCPNYLFIIMAHMAGFSWHERISSLRCCEALATSFITLPSTSTFRFIHGLILGKLVQITGLQGNYFAIKSLTMNKADGVNFIVSMGCGATCAGPAATPSTGAPASSSSGSSGPRWTRDLPPSQSRTSRWAPRWCRQRPGPHPTPGEPLKMVSFIRARCFPEKSQFISSPGYSRWGGAPVFFGWISWLDPQSDGTCLKK